MNRRATAILIDLSQEARSHHHDLLDTPQTRLRSYIDPYRALVECRNTAPRRILVRLSRLGPREARLLRALARVRGDAEVVVLVPKPLRTRAAEWIPDPKFRVADTTRWVEEMRGAVAAENLEASAGPPAPRVEPGPDRDAAHDSPSDDDRSPSPSPRVPSDVESELEWLRTLSPHLGDLDEILRCTIERAIHDLKATRGSIQFVDDGGRELRIIKAIGKGSSLLEEMVRPISSGIAGAVVQQRRPKRGLDGVPEADPLPQPLRADLAGPYLSVPLEFGGRILGAMHVVRTRDGVEFTDTDQERLLAIVGSAAGFIRNALDMREKERLALVDPLTALYNRRYFDRQFPAEIRRAQRFRHPVTLLLLDIDDFKSYNDRCGYLEGDEALRAVARVLLRTFRTVDVVTRWGGEEFAILLPETSRDETGDGPPAFVSRLLEAMRRARFRHGSAQPGGALTLSGGYATYPVDTQDPGELIALANRALRQAKTQGKNRIEPA